MRLSFGASGFGKLQHDAELLKHAERIPVDPALHGLAGGDGADAHAGKGECFAGGCNAAEIAIAGAPECPADYDLVVLGNQVVDGEAKVGERGSVEGDSLFFTLRAAAKIGRGWVVVGVGRVENFVRYWKISFVPKVLKPSTATVLVASDIEFSPSVEDTQSLPA